MDVTKACRDLDELSPKAKKACSLFLAECKRQGLSVLVTETYRSQGRQDYLYEQGRTRPGQKVTWTQNSNHTGRMAWDICKNVKGQEYSDKNFFKQCGNIAASLGITWGGTWKTPDMPHFEIPTNWVEPVQEEIMEKEKIIFDGKSYNIDMVRVDGSAFVSVRQLAEIIGYGIGNQGKTPVITTKK